MEKARFMSLDVQLFKQDFEILELLIMGALQCMHCIIR